MQTTSTQKTRLAIVVPELLPVPPIKGGAVEHWVDEVSKRLNQNKFDISIISRPANDEGYAGLTYLAIPWTKTELFFAKLKEKFTWKHPLRYIAKIQNVASYGMRMAKLVKHHELVVIHNEPNLLLFMHHNPQQTIILHMHNEHLTTKLFRPLYRLALKKVNMVICVSDYIRRSAVAHFPEHASKFTVVFNATNPDIFMPYGDMAIQALTDTVNIEPDKQYLLYVGRLTEIKGVHILIESFAKLLKQYPASRLIIVGSSFFEGAVKTEYERALISLAEPISEFILFTGFIPHEKLKYLYSIADVVVLPSIWQDPCPLVVLEAMSSGSCLISSAVGGVPEVVMDGVNGILVTPNNASTLADAVIKLLQNSSLKQQIEQTAREHILQGYTWERLVAQLETHYLISQ